MSSMMDPTVVPVPLRARRIDGDAMRVTTDNASNVLEWIRELGGEGQLMPESETFVSTIRITVYAGRIFARASDFVVYLAGDFIVVPIDRFLSLTEPIGPNTGRCSAACSEGHQFDSRCTGGTWSIDPPRAQPPAPPMPSS